MKEKREAKRVALFDSHTWFAGFDTDHGGPLPNSATYVLPELNKGYIPKWDGEKWTQIETHVGESGFVNGQAVLIAEHGPYPEGWSREYVDPRTPEEIKKAEILARLGALDLERIRPIGAILNGAGTDEDKTRLSALETEAASLRSELQALATQC